MKSEAKPAMVDYLQIPLFEGLSRVDVARIVPELDEVALEPGEMLLHQGDLGDALFIVRSGRLRAELAASDGTTVLDVLGPGQVIGEVALLSGAPRTATVRATEPTTVWRLSRQKLDALILKHPSFALHFNRVVGQRLANVSSHLEQTKGWLAGMRQIAQATLAPGMWERIGRAAPLHALTDKAVDLLADGDSSTFLAELTAMDLVEAVEDGTYVLKPGIRAVAAQHYREQVGERGFQEWARTLAALCRERADYGNAVEAWLEGGAPAEAAVLLDDFEAELVAAWGSAQVARWARRATPARVSSVGSPAVGSSTRRTGVARQVWRRIFTTIVAVSVAFGTWLALPADLSPEAHKLIAVLAGATVLWLADIAPEFFTAVLVCIVAVLWNVADPSVALSGMMASSFFLLFVIFGCINFVMRSGLAFRTALLGLKLLPATYNGQIWALGLLGLIATPLVPSNLGRLTMVSPLIVAIKDALRLPDRSRGSAGLALAAYMGYGQMAFLFMNGTATCLLIAGLLPPDVARRLTWTNWLVAAFPLGLVYFVGSMLAILWRFRPERRALADQGVLRAQLVTLGRLDYQERLGVIALTLLLLIFVLQPLHTIDPAWLAIVMITVLFVLGADRAMFNSIDYKFLLYFGAFSSISTMFRSTGADKAMVAAVQPYLLLLPASPYVLLSVLCVVSLLLASLPGFPSQPALMIATIPVATSLGYNPFVFGLIILATILPGLVPSLSTLHGMFWNATEQRSFTYAHIQELAVLRAAVLLLAICVSIPFWQMLGMVP